MRQHKSIRIGLIQHACPVDASPDVNLDKASAMIRDAAGQGAQLVITQELFTSFYFAQWEDERHFAFAEPIPGATTQRLSELARELRIELSASIYEQAEGGKRYNTTVVLDAAGKIAAKYRKMHIPYDPRFYEKFYFEPGDLGFVTYDTPQTRISPLICYDQWFPEAARVSAINGAMLLLYPTAIGWDHDEPDDVGQAQLAAWQTMQRSHAIANAVFVAAVNRVGTEGDLTFWGHSFVCGPDGQVIAEASADQEEVLIADCDLTQIEPLRKVWPFFRDRRPEAYRTLA